MTKYNIKNFGATENTLCTKAIQLAIDEASTNGGGISRQLLVGSRGLSGGSCRHRDHKGGCQQCGGYPLCYYAVPISDGRITDFFTGGKTL